MNRVNAKPVKIGDKRTRYIFQLFDDPTEPDSNEMRRRLNGFFQELIDQPALLNCGHSYAQKIVIAHDGKCWVLTGEAEVDDA